MDAAMEAQKAPIQPVLCCSWWRPKKTTFHQLPAGEGRGKMGEGAGVERAEGGCAGAPGPSGGGGPDCAWHGAALRRSRHPSSRRGRQKHIPLSTAPRTQEQVQAKEAQRRRQVAGPPAAAPRQPERGALEDFQRDPDQRKHIVGRRPAQLGQPLVPALLKGGHQPLHAKHDGKRARQRPVGAAERAGWRARGRRGAFPFLSFGWLKQEKCSGCGGGSGGGRWDRTP